MLEEKRQFKKMSRREKTAWTFVRSLLSIAP
jgi:hypothetical protein